MSNVKFTLSLPGLNVLMKSPEMQSIINNAAAQISNGRGDVEVESAHPISFIAIGSVRPMKDKKRTEKEMGGARI